MTTVPAAAASLFADAAEPTVRLAMAAIAAAYEHDRSLGHATSLCVETRSASRPSRRLLLSISETPLQSSAAIKFRK